MRELSPAARAALVASTQRLFGLDPEDVPTSASEDAVAIASALRALADHQQAPIGDEPVDHWNPDERTRRELRNLAAELEGDG